MQLLHRIARAVSEPLALLYRHRTLVWELAKRDVTDRYTGQVLGILWGVGHPLILCVFYVLIFRFVFKQTLTKEDMPLDFSAYIFAGLFPWIAFQEALMKGSLTMISHASLVKQVAFPIEVLPFKGTLASLVSQLVGTACLMIYVLVGYGYVPWTYVLLPVLWTVQLLGMAGVAFIVAAVGAYFRDLKDFCQVFCLVGMYLMPVFYDPNALPRAVRPLLYFNPLSYMGWCFQDVCYYGRFEHPWAWPVFLLGSLLTFALGYRVFGKLKVSFGSVL